MREWRYLLLMVGLGLCAGCQRADDRRAASASYDNFSRQLVQLSADQNGDGRICFEKNDRPCL